MRRRLKNFLPIVLIALVVQIFAPIGACWAASIAASDPLAGAVICHGNASSTSGQSDQAGHRAHDGCCSACSVLQTGEVEPGVGKTVERADLKAADTPALPGYFRNSAR